MTLHLSWYDDCVAVAIINLLLAALLVSMLKKARNRKANVMLAVLMLCLAISFLGDILGVNDFFKSYPHWMEYDPFLTLLLGPLLYSYILYQTRPGFRLRLRHLLHLLPLLIYFLLLWEFYTSGSSIKLAYLKQGNRSNIPHYDLASYFKEAQLFLYGVVCYRLLLQHGRVIQEVASAVENRQLHWLRNLLLMATILFVAWLIVNETNHTTYILGLTLLGFSYWVSYHAIAQEYVFGQAEAAAVQLIVLENEQEKEVRYRNSTLTPEDMQVLMARIATHMDEAKSYLNNELSLTALAEQLELNPNHLSQVLNEGFGESFYKFVNRYRVEESKRLLRDPACAHYNMLGIAYQAGFNAKSTFYKAFKDIVGCSPSEFAKNS
ncbi:helix-turn-helix domain-containing protein [Hymenobacter terrenus]|uniref:helix-turn-helix domain-containing protein n=1 Tax=Hymenobacter terrenus TaxID=1629124 RepID=UPI0006964223|nr:helix-turn-helix transcriptional regulator [Hymenobacter terrenus]